MTLESFYDLVFAIFVIVGIFGMAFAIKMLGYYQGMRAGYRKREFEEWAEASDIFPPDTTPMNRNEDLKLMLLLRKAKKRAEDERSVGVYSLEPALRWSEEQVHGKKKAQRVYEVRIGKRDRV